MSLWFNLQANDTLIARVVIRRLTHYDLDDPGVADRTSNYEVTLDGQVVGTVVHRYGDGPYDLTGKAMALISVWMEANDIDPVGARFT